MQRCLGIDSFWSLQLIRGSSFFFSFFKLLFLPGRAGWKQVLRTGIFSTSRAVLCQHNSHPSEVLANFVGSLPGVKTVL